VDVAVFTNLSVDHLDYHGDLENYARTKQRLFDSLSSEGVAVVNALDPYASQMERAARERGARVVLFGEKGSGLWAESVVMEREGTSFTLCSVDASTSAQS
jgi:UDP-N-acetylmuramoyl-L-alanyl-D-glutamate--2,6-diaminopimelate ligase